MLKSIVVGAVVLGSIVVPAQAVFADEPLFRCVVRITEGGSSTGGTFDGYALGYAIHPGEASSLWLTCTITVNGWLVASVSGGSGGAVVAQGPVSFTASRSDNVEIHATLSSSHGTQTKSFRYFPYDEQPVEVLTGESYDCGLDAVRPGDPADNYDYEGVARGYVARARGGVVTIRCYVRVDGSEQQLSATATGTGTGAAATSGRVMFRATPWSTVEIVAEVTTPEGTYSTARPYSPTGVPDIEAGALPSDFGCGLQGVGEEQDYSSTYYYEGTAYGYVTDPNADVTIRCYVTVGGYEDWRQSTPTGTGRDVAATQGSVTFYRSWWDGDVELCAEMTTSDGLTDTRCHETTTTYVPVAEVVDSVEPLIDNFLWGVKPLSDPLLCPYLPWLWGSWGPVTIDWQDGDVFLDGERVYDCWPYAWYDDDSRGVEIITG